MSTRRAFSCVALSFVMAVSSTQAVAQSVAIAPQVLVVDARARTGAVTLLNGSDTPAEVSLSVLYGYPVTDAVGTMQLKTFASVSDTAPSAAPWLQPYPRRLRIEPRMRRTVRLMVAPPDSLRDREYWARLVVAAKGGRIAVQAPNNSNINVGLDVEVRSVLPFFYRKGVMNTGVSLELPRGMVVGDSVLVQTKLTRTGNAAYIGMLTASLRDSRNRVVRQTTLPIGVYYTLDPRVAIPCAGVATGTYRLVVETVTARPDVEKKLLVQGAPARVESTLAIP